MEKVEKHVKETFSPQSNEASNSYLKSESDLMEAAFELAREALGAGEVPVGCVLVTEEGLVVGKGRNTVNETKNATRHAEINAIDMVEDAGRGDLYPKLSVFVNVEPCIMCAAALAKLNIPKITFGCSNDKFGGCGGTGEPVFKGEVQGGVRRDEAVALLKGFYDQENPFAPSPKVKGVKIEKTKHLKSKS